MGQVGESVSFQAKAGTQLMWDGAAGLWCDQLDLKCGYQSLIPALTFINKGQRKKIYNFKDCNLNRK